VAIVCIATYRNS